MEILNSPVGMVALDQSTYTELDFYAYNLESDFSGYKISVGTSKAEARASKSYATCLFTKNSNLNVPTRIQLGGAAQPGFDCYISAADAPPFTIPLTAGSNSWVSVKSFGSRDCRQYAADSGCSEFSDSASAEVLPYIEPPASVTIQNLSSYYLVTVTMGPAIPANFTGFGLFYSPNKNEAEFKASEDGSIVDGLCQINPFPAPNAPLQIQIGGTQAAGMDCYISNFFLNTGDTLAIRNFITSPTRTKFPWSDFVSVTVP